MIARSLFVSIVAAVVCFADASVFVSDADALKITPGRWKFTSVAKNNMMPQPKTESHTECVKDGERGPEEFLADMKDAPECKVTVVTDTDAEMAWKMDCSQPGMGTMTGDANMKSSGNLVEGTMNMNMAMGGMQMNSTYTWTGQWLGECE